MNRKIAVVGLGYVGLPITAAFGKNQHVVAFDVNKNRIAELKHGIDKNKSASFADLKGNIKFTSYPEDLKESDFIIIAVPTPVNKSNRPDFTPLINASKIVGKFLNKNSIVVFESTVYPGATEEICLPILEKESGMKCPEDFKIGYSPERINPGDDEHTFTKITKVVSGIDEESLDIIAEVYAKVIDAGVYRASSIKVAEAAKVIENTQRDLNIALINELSVIFHKIGIDTLDVLDAAATKWNFLKFKPGLVGGHCIGVDPYYLTHKAEELGYIPQVILSGRKINDGMGEFIAKEVAKLLKFKTTNPTVTILGVTFKENIPDIRNSKVLDIVKELKSYGFTIQISDPIANAEEVKKEYGIDLIPLYQTRQADVVILAVPHKLFVDCGWHLMSDLLNSESGIVADLKGVLPRENKPKEITLWRL